MGTRKRAIGVLSELAKAQRIPPPSPNFSELYDEEFEEDEPGSGTALPQNEGPEEPSYDAIIAFQPGS